MIEVALGLLAVGPLSVWAVALTLSERRKTQPALSAYLTVTALTWAVLMVGRPAGWFASETNYAFFYIASEVVTWGLLAATFLELASLRLERFPQMRRAADSLIHWFFVACAVAIVGFVFAPESILNSTREFHHVERSLIQICLALGWVLFFLAGKYFSVEPQGRNAAEGWALCALYFGCALLQPSHSFATWLAISVLSALCYGYGAFLHFRGEESAVPPKPGPRASSEDDEIALLQIRARLENLDRRLDSIGKG